MRPIYGVVIWNERESNRRVRHAHQRYPPYATYGARGVPYGSVRNITYSNLCSKNKHIRILGLCSESLPRPRMRLVVDTGQVLEIEMRVDLGRAQVRMAQQFLHRAQVA